MINKTNLILFHLESFSSNLWDLWRKRLPTLNEIYNSSTIYSSAFAASTSTDMARINLFLSSANAYDSFAKFPEHHEVSFEKYKNIFVVLEENGYSINGISYEDYLDNSTKFMLDWKIWRHDLGHDFEYILTQEKLQKKFNDIFCQEQPFALYFQNLFSHIQYGLALKEKTTSFGDSLLAGYQEVDKSLKILLDSLKRYNRMEKTLIVFFGDHGDDYWWHGYNPVLAHGLIPLATQIHVPLFFYKTNSSITLDSTIVSMTECASLILRKLGITSPWNSIDNVEINPTIGKVIFSQNMFLNQPSRHLWNKGFSIVSQRYLLIASDIGLGLFDWQADPENHCNLLNFFKLYKDGKIKKRKNKEYPIVNAMLSDSICTQILLEFPILLSLLKMYIHKKEKAVGYNLVNPIPRRYFTQIMNPNDKKAMFEMRHPLVMSLLIQLHYYRSIIKENGIIYLLIRAWKRLKRGGRRASRGW